MSSLPSVRSGLRRHTVRKQVLVYDPRGERVHLLDPASACVLELLQEGGWTEQGIRQELSVRTGSVASEQFFSLALDELRKADLLEPDAAVPAPLVDLERRQMLRKLAAAGIAALLVPTIATITADPAYAQTGTGICTACAGKNGEQSTCGPGLECQHAICIDPNACGDKNAPCTLECQCCKGDCKPPDKAGNRECA
jgi:hypothetical protein